MLKLNMKLFRRSNGYWYVRFERGKEKSLRTKDRRLAEKLFKEIQKEVLKGKIILLEKQEKISLSEFIQEYLKWAETRKSSSTVYRDRWALTKFLEFSSPNNFESSTASFMATFKGISSRLIIS